MANNITNVWKLMGINPTTGTGTYKNRMGLGNAITRDNGIPLDLSALHATFNDAVVYAATSSIAYVDQPVAAEGVLYLITEESQGKVKISSYRDSITGKLISGEEKEYDIYLKRVGIVPTGDEASITVNGEGLIKLFAFDGAQAGAVPVKEDGKLVWKTLEEIGAGDGNDNTTYEFAVCDHGTGLVITPLFNGQPIMEGEGEEAKQVKYHLDLDVYTKKEVDDAIAEAVDGLVDEDALADAIKDFATKNYIDGEIDKVEEAIAAIDFVDENELNAALAPYAKTADVNTELDKKAKQTDLEALQNRVDAFLTGEGTEAALDSLKELIAYIESHDDVDIAGILEDIQGLENKLAGIDTTVVAYVTSAIEALKIGDYAKASDLTDLAARVKTLEDVDNFTQAEFNTFKTENDQAIATAKQEAIDAAALAVTNAAYATKAELEAHEEAAEVAYATKAELKAHAEAAEAAYATKDELKATDGVAKDAQNRVGIVEGKIDEITSVGGEPNVIEKIKVNGVTLEVEKDAEGKSTKTVSIAVPTSIVGMDGYSALDGRVTENTNCIAALTGQLGTTNTNVSGLTTRIAALEAEVGEVAESRIDALEGVTAQHTTDIGANTTAITKINTETIPALQSVVNTKAAQTDVDAINAKIGTVEEGKTVVDMINAVAGKIDFSPYAKKDEVAATYATIAALEGIYKAGEGEVAATGVLAEEITRAKAAEKKLSDDLAILINNPTEDLDSVVEIIEHVKNNGTAVTGIIGRLDGHDTLLAGIGGEGQPATVVAAIEAAKYALPGATVEALGGIKSAADVDGKVAVNKVYVDATTNIAEVKAFSTDNLVQGNMTLVLNGGNASGAATIA